MKSASKNVPCEEHDLQHVITAVGVVLSGISAACRVKLAAFAFPVAVAMLLLVMYTMGS